MRLLRQGELYALDRRAGIEPQLEEMRRRFHMKHKTKPTDECWNPKGYRFECDLRVDPTIPPGTVWLEVAHKEKE
jgi:hypothetical protein